MIDYFDSDDKLFGKSKKSITVNLRPQKSKIQTFAKSIYEYLYIYINLKLRFKGFKNFSFGFFGFNYKKGFTVVVPVQCSLVILEYSYTLI